MLALEKGTDGGEMVSRELACLPEYRFAFALCVIKDRYVLLTGGRDKEEKHVTSVFMFDTEQNEWIISPLQPNLRKTRF